MNHLPTKVTAIAIYIFSFIGLFFFTVQDNFYQLIFLYGCSFYVYYLLWKSNEQDEKLIFGLGFVVRLIAVFSLPLLSDDIYRFLWDGNIFWAGVNPYAYTPAEIIENRLYPDQMGLYPLMNSPNYYTVYPPFLQYIFRLVTIPILETVTGQLLAFKGLILLCELGTFTLIKKLSSVKIFKFSSLSRQNVVLLYWLNPLVILEGVGNIHPEIIVILFVMMAIYGTIKYSQTSTVIGYIGSVATKLNPAILLLPLIKYQWHKEGIKHIFIATITGVVIFIGMATDFRDSAYIPHFIQSLRLYFQSFEFNGSVYYVVNSIVSYFNGYNSIGIVSPILSVIALVMILGLALLRPTQNIRDVMLTMLLIWSVYLFMSTTVHPWYLLPVISLAALLGSRYIILWSFLIVLSYSHYTEMDQWVKTGFLVLEYGGLIVYLLHSASGLNNPFVRK